MKSLKIFNLAGLIIGYLYAGINHFRNPASYWPIIPAYIPCPKVINILAGTFEIAFSLLLIHPKSRQLAAWGIILMLIAFLPVHIDMVIHAPLKLGSLNVTPMMAWLRLIILQPLLILWAWWYAKTACFYPVN